MFKNRKTGWGLRDVNCMLMLVTEESPVGGGGDTRGKIRRARLDKHSRYIFSMWRDKNPQDGEKTLSALAMWRDGRLQGERGGRPEGPRADGGCLQVCGPWGKKTFLKPFTNTSQLLVPCLPLDCLLTLMEWIFLFLFSVPVSCSCFLFLNFSVLLSSSAESCGIKISRKMWHFHLLWGSVIWGRRRSKPGLLAEEIRPSLGKAEHYGLGYSSYLKYTSLVFK